MKSVNGYAKGKAFIYPHYVLKAVMDSGLRNYPNDVDYYVLEYNGKWYTYDKLSRNMPFLNLPILNLSEMVEAN